MSDQVFNIEANRKNKPDLYKKVALKNWHKKGSSAHRICEDAHFYYRLSMPSYRQYDSY